MLYIIPLTQSEDHPEVEVEVVHPTYMNLTVYNLDVVLGQEAYLMAVLLVPDGIYPINDSITTGLYGILNKVAKDAPTALIAPPLLVGYRTHLRHIVGVDYWRKTVGINESHIPKR